MSGALEPGGKEARARATEPSAEFEERKRIRFQEGSSAILPLPPKGGRGKMAELR